MRRISKTEGKGVAWLRSVAVAAVLVFFVGGTSLAAEKEDGAGAQTAPSTPQSGETLKEPAQPSETTPKNGASVPEQLPPKEPLPPAGGTANSGQDGAEAAPGDTDVQRNAKTGGDAAESQKRVAGNDPTFVPSGITCAGGRTPCIVDQTAQALRIITRTATPLYADADEKGTIRSDAVAAFQPAFVFERKDLDFSDPVAPKGWYRVGYTATTPIGWMKAADVMEWRQALLVAFLHPGTGTDRRMPVLQFETREALKEGVVRANDRVGRAKALYDTLSASKKPDGVIATEPPEFIDIDDRFYLMPILEWEAEPRYEDSHYLRIMNAVPGSRAEPGEGTLEDSEVLKEPLRRDGRDIKDLRVDIKFVIDMTGSMQPYIDQVAEAAGKLASRIENGSPGDFAKFGLIGFRDSVEISPGLKWTTKNFTPGLVDAGELRDLLKNGGQPLAADVTSDEWREDVFAGVRLALQSPWSTESNEDGNVRRVIVLIGDASGHEADSTKSSTGMTPEHLRQIANQSNTLISTYYLKDGVAAADWPVGIEQFSILGRNQSSEADGKLGSHEIEVTRIGELSFQFDSIAKVVEELGKLVAAGNNKGAKGFAKDGQALPRSEVPKGVDENSAEAGVAVIENVFRAAVIEYLGSDGAPGKDFIAWVHDFDLQDSFTQRLEIRVLVSRQIMDNIIRQTQTIYDAMVTAKQARMDFYTALQTVSAQTALGQDVTADATLGEQGFLPKWVSALPYRSEVLGLRPRALAEMSETDKHLFEARLKSKLKSYQDIFNNSGRWIELDEGGDDLQKVTALPLTLLP